MGGETIADQPEHKGTTVPIETTPGATATAIPPKVEVFDRIAEILEGTNKNLRLAWIGIYIAIILFIINMALQYFKII